jgi:hypothetical protein
MLFHASEHLFFSAAITLTVPDTVFIVSGYFTMATTEAAPAAAGTPAAPVAAPVYMDYQSGHAELTRSLCQSFQEGPGEGIRLLEQSCESLVSQDGENKKLVLDQAHSRYLFTMRVDLVPFKCSKKNGSVFKFAQLVSGQFCFS